MEPNAPHPFEQPEHAPSTPPVEQSAPQPEAPEQPEVSPHHHRKLRHKKRLFVVLFIVAILLVAGFVITSALWHRVTPVAVEPREIVNSTPDYDNSSFTVETTVTITDGAFSPSSILIKPHTRVNIQNNDASSHWLSLNDSTQKDGPATSDENDPDLPDRAEIVTGGGYSHVFEKPDTYMFHLADVPQSNLSITVEQ